MKQRYRLPLREKVFIESLMYHGFRKCRRRRNLKYKRGYVIPATQAEDSGGIDFWVKMPRDSRLFPVQITQRGVRLYLRLSKPTAQMRAVFEERSLKRVEKKRRICYRNGIAFVLVRDTNEKNTCVRTAQSDVAALRYAIATLKRWL